MQYHFIINPQAGSGKGKLAWESLESQLNQEGINYRAFWSKYAGHPRTLARNLGQQHLQDSCVVVIGGDGTLHEVIQGLMSTSMDDPIPTAYIPAGTGNDFARAYRISFDPLTAWQQIKNNRQQHWINVGVYKNYSQEGIFLNNLGIGFDASIVNRTVDSKMRDFLNHHHIGKLAYSTKAVDSLIHQPGFHLQVQHGGQIIDFPRAFLVICSNHPYIGGGIKVAPDQQITQPEFELAIVERRHWATLLWSTLMFAGGRLIHSRFAHIFRGSEMNYRISSPQYGQADGEVLGKRTFDLHISSRRWPMWELRR